MSRLTLPSFFHQFTLIFDELAREKYVDWYGYSASVSPYILEQFEKEMVDITHECGKEAMMFLGDHWIGTEPFMDEFKTIGLDAVVGSVGNGATLRLISDIEGVRYTAGRFLPYFFPWAQK